MYDILVRAHEIAFEVLLVCFRGAMRVISSTTDSGHFGRPALISRWLTSEPNGRSMPYRRPTVYMVDLGVVIAQYNGTVTTEMAANAREAAVDRGARILKEVPVPGVYDSPLAVDRLARRESVDAVAVVGAIVTGDTAHDRVIGDATAAKLTDISLNRDTPVTFGVSGPGMSGAEARERVEKGAEAVNAAIDLAQEVPT